MNPKIISEHLHRGALVYVRQSTFGQVMEHTESKRRQYALADAARDLGFASVSTIDDDGVYDPRLVNDRLLLGLKGTMSEYELSLLRQRGLAARDAKAKRGELRFAWPPGYCWNGLGRIEIDPNERVSKAIGLLFRKFQELGSARQVFLWTLQSGLKLPVLGQSPVGGMALT